MVGYICLYNMKVFVEAMDHNFDIKSIQLKNFSTSFSSSFFASVLQTTLKVYQHAVRVASQMSSLDLAPRFQEETCL